MIAPKTIIPFITLKCQPQINVVGFFLCLKSGCQFQTSWWQGACREHTIPEHLAGVLDATDSAIIYVWALIVNASQQHKSVRFVFLGFKVPLSSNRLKRMSGS